MENKVKQAGPINLLHVMPYLSFTSQIHSFSLNYAYGQSLLSIFIALILLNKNLTLLDRIYRTRAVKFISLGQHFYLIKTGI